MTYKVFNDSYRWMRIALPLFMVAVGLLSIAFRSSVVTAQHKEALQCAEKTSIELSFFGFNP